MLQSLRPVCRFWGPHFALTPGLASQGIGCRRSILSNDAVGYLTGRALKTVAHGRTHSFSFPYCMTKNSRSPATWGRRCVHLISFGSTVRWRVCISGQALIASGAIRALSTPHANCSRPCARGENRKWSKQQTLRWVLNQMENPDEPIACIWT